MSDLKKEIDVLVGNGQTMRIVTGRDKDSGESIVEEFHFCPVPLIDLPKLQEGLNGFFEAEGKGAWNDDALKNAGELIVLSLKRMHPDITVEQVLGIFSLGTLAKAIKIAMDINDFLSEMGEIRKGISLGQEMSKLANRSQSKEQ